MKKKYPKILESQSEYKLDTEKINKLLDDTFYKNEDIDYIKKILKDLAKE